MHHIVHWFRHRLNHLFHHFVRMNGFEIFLDVFLRGRSVGGSLGKAGTAESAAQCYGDEEAVHNSTSISVFRVMHCRGLVYWIPGRCEATCYPRPACHSYHNLGPPLTALRPCFSGVRRTSPVATARAAPTLSS